MTGVILAVVAAIGALGFQLALTTGAAKPKQPELGYLPKPATSNNLWQDLSLDTCMSPNNLVPVLITSGSGSNEDPYHLTVIAVTPTCQPKSFISRNQDLTVEKLAAPSVAITQGN